MDFIQSLLSDINNNGEWKTPAREGMPRTKSIFSREFRFNLQEGFPAITTKELYWKGVFTELIWFLRGDTNIKYLVENYCNIWNQDAYKYYCKLYKQDMSKRAIQNLLTLDEFVSSIKFQTIEDLKNFQGISNYSLGDCGNIYGYQWKDWERKHRDTGFDQIQNLISSIEKNPNSRYHIVTAWQPTDFLRDQDAALPACHMMFQVYIRQGKYLDLKMIQRSCDTFLGVPFNVASYSLLTHILADLTGYKVGEFIWSGNDIHYYENQQEAVDEILTRKSYPFPRLINSQRYYKLLQEYHAKLISFNSFMRLLTIEDFGFLDYKSHPKLKAPLSVGI